MNSKARLSVVLGAALVGGSALLAASPGAMADTLPTPDPPQVISATVTGCYQGQCEPGQTGELVVDGKAPPMPSGAPSDARMQVLFYLNNKDITSDVNAGGPGGTEFPICSSNAVAYPCIPGYGAVALGNHPVITEKARVLAGNPDDNTFQAGPLSDSSNSVTVNLGG